MQFYFTNNKSLSLKLKTYKLDCGEVICDFSAISVSLICRLLLLTDQFLPHRFAFDLRYSVGLRKENYKMVVHLSYVFVLILFLLIHLVGFFSRLFLFVPLCCPNHMVNSKVDFHPVGKYRDLQDSQIKMSASPLHLET